MQYRSREAGQRGPDTVRHHRSNGPRETLGIFDLRVKGLITGERRELYGKNPPTTTHSCTGCSV